MSRDDTATSAPRFALPDQPDGITDDSRDLPDPMRAARRIRAYITGAGDGLYDTVDPGDGHRPLYGRDLESVCRALVSRTRERDAALVRAEDHRRAAHEAAGQLDRLRREVERTRHHDMYERAYFDVQSVLDNALGRDAEDGAGGGVAADVALLAQRYADLRAAVLTEVASPSSWWADRVAQIEAAELREEDDFPQPCQPIGCDAGRHLTGCVFASVDCEDPWHSTPGETAPPEPCATCGACGTEG